MNDKKNQKDIQDGGNGFYSRIYGPSPLGVPVRVPFGVPMAPTNISASIPMVDPIFGTQGYLTGPPINLFPRRRYSQPGAKMRIGYTTEDPGLGLKISGNPRDLLSLMQKISAAKNKSSDDYSPFSEEEVANVVNRLDSPISGQSQVIRQTSDIPSGWSFIKQPNNRIFLAHNNNGILKYYSGSGVLIFERNYRSQNGNNGHAVILFRSSKNGEYEDLGGGIEIVDYNGPDTLLNTCKRETKEESCNLFNIDKIDKSSIYGYSGTSYSIDREAYGDIYRCYAIGLAENQRNETWKDIYHNNRRIIQQQAAPSGWQETDDMERFYVSDLLNCLGQQVHGPLRCRDANGLEKNISSRTKACLKLLLNGFSSGTSIGNSAISNPRKITTVYNDISDKPFLKNTVTLVVN